MTTGAPGAIGGDSAVTLDGTGYVTSSATMAPPGTPAAIVDMLNREVNAALADAPAGAWLSAYFGQPLKLVYMDAAAERLRRDSEGKFIVLDAVHWT